MDPSMFVLTAALDLDGTRPRCPGLGVFGGTVVHLMMKSGAFADLLRDGIGIVGCGGAKIRAPKPVVWRLGRPDRRASFCKTARPPRCSPRLTPSPESRCWRGSRQKP
jgi:hypothetical protein